MRQVGPHAHAITRRPLLVAGEQRRQRGAVLQLQRVQRLRAAEGHRAYGGIHAVAAVAGHQVVRAQQHPHRAAHREAQVAAGLQFAQGRGQPAARQHARRQELALADEGRHEGRGGAVVQLEAGRPLQQAAGLHHAHAVGEGERFFLVVGDQQRRDAQLPQQLAQVLAQAAAQVGVEAGEGFVEQQQVGPRRERARQGDALLLAAGEFVGVALRQAVEAEQGEGVEAARLTRAAVKAVQAEADVVGHGEVREQRQVLEHEAEAAFFRRQRQRVHAAKAQGAGVGRVQARDGAKQGGLAAAAGPEQAAQFAGGKREPQPGHGRLACVRAGQPVDLEQGPGCRHQFIWLATKSQFTRFQNASTYFGRALR